MILSTSAIIVVVALLSLLAFGLATVQSLIGAKVGTDHSVHAFLVRAIQANSHRFFVRIPRLLNTAYCAALPLYIHWLLSYCRSGVMFWAERLLNPTINGLHTVFFAFLVFYGSASLFQDQSIAFTSIALFALTPQFYHALSARNFGLSARGTGLLLLTIFLFACHGWEQADGQWAFAFLLVVASYLIWAFSTFGAQALVIISTLLCVLTGHRAPILGTFAGLTVFIAIHPRYSLAYLHHTGRFIHAYASQLAAIYILNRRHSIWRDLIWDIWIKIKASPKQGFRYAYENTIFIVVLLNPLLVFTLISIGSGAPRANGFMEYSADVALCGAVGALLTSFRPTRFLGEPERYVEAVTPWSTIVGTYFITANFGLHVAMMLVVVFAAMNALQITATRILVNYMQSKPIRLDTAEAAIRSSGIKSIRCCSNNEQWTKLLMANDWDFAYYIAAGQDYCGMRLEQAFSSFPFLRKEACERIVEEYKINICVLDRSLYESLFDTYPTSLERVDTIYESAGMRVLALSWKESRSEVRTQ